MKTSVSQFEIFKKEFQRMVNLLNLKDWDINFKFEKIDSSAQILWITNGRIAIVTLNNTHDEKSFNPIKVARHEAWHLFNSQLDDYSKARFVTLEEIEKLLEKMSTIMERYDLVEDQE